MRISPRSILDNKQGSRGFTLFELLVGIALIGLLVGLVVTGVNQYLDRDMKKASNRLAATIRYLYNKAATDGSYIRLVLDLEARNYWVEATSDPYVMENASDIREKKRASKETKEEKRDEKKPEQTSTDDDAYTKTTSPTGKKPPKTQRAGDIGEIKKLLPKEPTFSAVDEHLLKPQQLPEAVYFKDVYVEHERKSIEVGKATISFFPNGYVEEAIINFRNESDDVHYSLKTHPVNGKVDIEDDYRRLEER